MNPPEFEGSKVDEDPMQFIEECYRIVAIMGVPPNEKAELVAYKLKRVARVWFYQWAVNRGIDVGPLIGRNSKPPSLTASFIWS